MTCTDSSHFMLLPQSDLEDHKKNDSFVSRNRKQSKLNGWTKRLALLVHAVMVLMYTTVFLYCWLYIRRTCPVQDGLAFAPYTGEYISQVFDHKHSTYVGKPSTELDEAWDKLLNNLNIRITEWEMSQIPGRKDQAVALPDGGYFASPNVYHNLHCIKHIHHYMYVDHYFPNITPKQKRANEYHNHHCLDMLRQSIMCTGDMQLLTMKWIPSSRIPTANYSSPHRCVNWQSLEAWTSSRKIVRLMEPGWLIHPILGSAYPDGLGDEIGELLHE